MNFLEMPNQPVSKALVIRRVPPKVELRPNVVNTLSREEVADAARQTKKLHRRVSNEEFSRALGYKSKGSFTASMGPFKNYGLGKVSKTFIPGKGYVSATKLVEVGGKRALRRAVHGQKAEQYVVRRQEARHFQEYRAADKAHKDLVADIGQKGKELPSPMKGTAFLQPNWAKEAEMKSVNIEAFAIKRGGRKNGQAVMVVPKNATKDTVNHEMAHLTPKRSGYRLHQVLSDPKKLMREEGRAEMATRSKGGYYKTDAPGTSGYIQMARNEDVRSFANMQDKMRRGNVLGEGKYSKESLDEFRGVQDKIYQARRARGRDTFVIGGDKKFRGNQYVDDKKRRKVRAGLVALGGGTAVGGGGYSAYRWNKKRSGS